MKKYLYIFKSELMSDMQYIFDIIIGFISYAILIFIFLNLWKYIYSSPEEVINGYSMNQMIWYVVMTELLWSSLKGRRLCRKICTDVRSGNIAYNITKPYNYIEYILFSHLGATTLRFCLIGIVGMTLGYIFLGTFPSLTIMNIIAILLSCLFSTIISILIITSIGLISFYIEDASPFYWVYSKFILIVGTLFPIEFFPKLLQPIIRYSPIYAISYAPAKLFVDFSWLACLKLYIIQIIYIVISFILVHFIYNKGVKKLNVNGG